MFKCTPIGAIEKTVHYLFDNVEVDTVTTSQSNKQTTKVFPFMSHGSHKFEVYMTAELDGMQLESNHLLYDVMCVVNGNETVIISSPFQVTEIMQGEQVSIPYSVYTPTSTTSEVVLTHNGVDPETGEPVQDEIVRVQIPFDFGVVPE